MLAFGSHIMDNVDLIHAGPLAVLRHDAELADLLLREIYKLTILEGHKFAIRQNVSLGALGDLEHQGKLTD